MSKIINTTDVIRLNVGRNIIMTTRETLMQIPKSILSMMFNGRWEQKLQRNQEGNSSFRFSFEEQSNIYVMDNENS
jgi:hypothetical protein